MPSSYHWLSWGSIKFRCFYILNWVLIGGVGMCREPLGCGCGCGGCVVAPNSHTHVRPSAIPTHSLFDTFPCCLVCHHKTGLTAVFQKMLAGITFHPDLIQLDVVCLGKERWRRKIRRKWEKGGSNSSELRRVWRQWNFLASLAITNTPDFGRLLILHPI